jgi:hypothetical protein
MSYRTREQLYQAFDDLVADHSSDMTKESIGTSVEGQPIPMYRIGKSNGSKVAFDVSHGNEHVGSECLELFAEWLFMGDSDAQRILQNNLLLIVPMLNIDRYSIIRENANGVDLNRNYPTGYVSPPTLEPETYAFRAMLQREQPKWYLNVHSGAGPRVTPPWGYTSTLPKDDAYLETVYNKYPPRYPVGYIPYVRMPNYGNGLARDEGYTLGIFTYAVEVILALQPPYSNVLTLVFPCFRPLVITVAREAEAAPKYLFDHWNNDEQDTNPTKTVEV